MVGIRAKSIGTILHRRAHRLGRPPYGSPQWPEKTNVGVDDFDAVNSSTLCVFGVEPPSDATVPGPRVL